MKREVVTPPSDWDEQMRRTLALDDTTNVEDVLCYDPAVAYSFTEDECGAILQASKQLHAMCILAVDYVCANKALMDNFLIPPEFRDLVCKSWNRSDPSLFGRFDLVYDPTNPTFAYPKLLEYEADAPTLLLDSALAQYQWGPMVIPHDRRFVNRVHERLLEAFRGLRERGIDRMTFSSLYGDGVADEYRQTVYLMGLAHQAGIETKFTALSDIGWDGRGPLVGLDNEKIDNWWKLYRWEWLVREEFGAALLEDRMTVIEPAWKMLLSSKALLPVLWTIFRDSPYLLPAYFDREPLAGSYVAKPIHGRMGEHITFVRPGQPDLVTSAPSPGLPGSRIYQQIAPVPKFGDHYAIVSSWMVGDEPAGIVVREGLSPIITGNDKAVGHYIL